MKRLVVCVALLAITIPSAFAQSPKAGDLAWETITYTPSSGEPVHAERGFLYVPANRSNPASGLYKLGMVRFKSTSATPGPPIVYLAGGPGGSGIESARGGRFPLFMAMREFGDVIAFDQRGTGISEPRPLIDIKNDYPLDQPVEIEAYTKPITEQVRNDLEKLAANGLDLQSFNTNESADDLNDLRKALGAEKISLWGISYGTHLGFATIRRHSDHIDKVILAGIEGPDQSVKLPSDQQDLLEELDRRVKLDPEMRDLVPDFLGLVREVLDTLEANPVMMRATIPGEGRADVMIDRWTMQYATANLLGTTSSSRTVPQMYYEAANGYFRRVARVSAEARKGSRRSYVMAILMDCASGATEQRMQQIYKEEKETLLGRSINTPFPEICEACDDLDIEIDLGDAFRGPLNSDVPALFISGTLDGRTSVENAEALLPGFPNAEHLIIDGAGHSDELFLSSPEILETMQAFMRGETLPKTRIELPAMTFAKPRQRYQFVRQLR